MMRRVISMSAGPVKPARPGKPAGATVLGFRKRTTVTYSQAYLKAREESRLWRETQNTCYGLVTR